ncbi:MAG TPA: DinB family protein [Longimicrobiales bacterium]|nr:DinB family protein [Longimicrobiales bacterium]
MVHDYSRLFEHMFWADTRILEMLDAEPGACTDEALTLFSHVLGSERVWLLRLTGGDSSAQPVWPDLPLPRLHALAASNAEGYGQFLAGLGEGDDGVDIVYSNSQGVPFRNAIGDILLHVALHGSYHRGQIARAVRAAGYEPVKTDYIAFARLDGN